MKRKIKNIKHIKIKLLILLIFCAFAIERFTFLIDTSYDPYSEYANSKKDERGILLDFEFIKNISAEDINGLFPEIDENEGNIRDLPMYNISLYRINYTSILAYEIVKLSGLIIVPQKGGSLSHLQYHHGTLFPYAYGEGESYLDVPSLYDGNLPATEYGQYESRLFGNFLGSYGYLVSMPDYIGYGASSSYEHTYSVNDRLAEQSVDMILATREFCTNLSIVLEEDKLFLAGWSEGGAATMATQKLIESSYKDEITITANAPLAGFFAIEFYCRLGISFAPFVFTDWGHEMDELLWAIYAINKYTDDEPLDTNEIFKFEVKNQLDVLKNRPTSVPTKCLQYFIKDKGKLLSKFAQNDLSDGWTPIAPIFVHHGTDDENVFYPFNTETTVNNLNKLGGNVELVKYEGHDHYTLDKLYLLNIIEEFNKF